MKLRLISSLILAGITVGCDSGDSSVKNIDHQSIVDLESSVQSWVGQYSGIVPCAPCLSRCEGCDGMAVDLTLHPNQSFKLVRESLSGHNDAEIIEGRFTFLNKDQLKIQLNGLSDRDIMFIDEESIEIIDSKTHSPFAAYDDFQLKKVA